MLVVITIGVETATLKPVPELEIDARVRADAGAYAVIGVHNLTGQYDGHASVWQILVTNGVPAS